ncbi:MAG: hypothetical protein BWY88_01351 [Synergistetes bacterium ADurb.Bin520]|nr:MAG: hypothetical protein BWY88_01351 [Synergistetes bacterium ADurb.Bin520]
MNRAAMDQRSCRNPSAARATPGQISRTREKFPRVNQAMASIKAH